MKTPRNTRLAVVGTVVVALAATGGAVAASKLRGGGHSGAAASPGTPISSGSGSGTGRWHGDGFRGGPMRHGDELAAAAAYLGISEDALVTELQTGKTLAEVANATSGKSASGLVDALVAQEKSELAQAVKDGRLTQAQADQMQQSLEQRVTDRVNGTGFGRGPGGPGGPGFGFGGHGHGPGGELAAAAAYLGISQDTLVTDLRSGKTLGQVADATAGKSKAGLVAALVAQEKAELAQAVTNGRLTQAQADRLSAALEQRVTNMVDGTFPPHPGGPPAAPSSGSPSAAPQHI
jgi:hypothetical protein